MATTPATTASYQPSRRSSTCPPWLQAALADIEQRVESLALGAPEKETDSFTERAENYYQKRPQLHSFLHDLHHQYRYLADRYSQSLLKSHSRKFSVDTEDDLEPLDSLSSDAESSLSFQAPLAPEREAELVGSITGLEVVVAELVGTLVERELVKSELSQAERHAAELARKAELQASLQEVMESERLVLLGENARLGLQAAASEAEARGLAAEVGYVRRRAGELARCVMKLREAHRVCLLSRRIEGLQAQVYALERRNRECYEAMKNRELEKGKAGIELDRLHHENQRLKEEAATAAARSRKGRSDGVARWWGRLTSMTGICMGPTYRSGRKKGARSTPGDGCGVLAFVRVSDSFLC